MVGSSTHFLRVYFNFGYYLSLVPFRFHRNKGSDRVIVTNSSKFKKALCLLVHSLIFCGYGVKSVREFHDQATQHLDFYFFVMWRLFMVCYMLAYFETVWRHSAHFLDVLQQLDREEEAISKGKLPLYMLDQIVGGVSSKKKRFEMKPTVRLFATMVCAFYTLPSIFIVFSAQLFSHNPTWDPYTNVYLYSLRAKEMFFFQDVDPERYEIIPDTLSGSEYATGLFYATFQFFNYLRDYYSDLLLMTCVFTLRSLSRRFARFLKSNNLASLAEISRKYNLVRDITIQINDIMRISFGLVLLQAPYVFMETVSKEHQTPMSFLYGVIFTITFFIIMYHAAAIVEDMREIKNWIRKGNSSKLNAPELLLMLEEVDRYPFGIQGLGLPVTTFRFVRIIVTIMISYGLLVVQLAPSDCTCVCEYPYPTVSTSTSTETIIAR